jgi:hypothetical protein
VALARRPEEDFAAEAPRPEEDFAAADLARLAGFAFEPELLDLLLLPPLRLCAMTHPSVAR